MLGSGIRLIFLLAMSKILDPRSTSRGTGIFRLRAHARCDAVVLRGTVIGHRHLLLLRAVFKIARPRQNPARRKYPADLRHQIGAGTGGLGFND